MKMSKMLILDDKSRMTLTSSFLREMALRILPQECDADKGFLTYAEYLQATSPRQWSYDAPHLQHIIKAVDKLASGNSTDRLAIFMPPRHAKTETVTIRKAAHLLEQADYRSEPINILVTAHTDQLARRFSRKIRAIVKSRIPLKFGTTAMNEWETAGGSLLVARGVGSPPHGIGFDWIFIDDPIKSREQAESEVYREKMHDWFEDIYTRLEPGAKVVLTLTRWHHDDIASRAIAQDPTSWEVLLFRALAEEDDPLGREVGAALWPARYNTEALHRIRSVLTREEGAYAWESLYQQNPTPREGAMFKVSQIEIMETNPVSIKSYVRAWDMAATEDGGNYTVGVLMGGPDQSGRYGVLDVIRGRWDPAERNRIIRQVAMMDGPSVRIRAPQDPGAAGKESAILFIRNLAGFPVVCRPVQGKKELRADGIASQVNAGNIWISRAPWNAEFIEELRQFPRGKHDDQVDAFADAFTELSGVYNEEALIEYYEPVSISRY
jgi:predicted phage terminase large subunit-like protein